MNYNITTVNLFQIDIRENEIFERSPELLSMLLKDHTLSTEDCQINIFWATNNYADWGVGFQYNDQITIDAITGKNREIIKPRAVKSREMQQQRSRDGRGFHKRCDFEKNHKHHPLSANNRQY